MHTFLSISFSVAFFFLIVNVAYIKILAPTILLRLRYKVFAIRDRARYRLIQKTIQEEEFSFIEDRCNFTISFIESANLAMFLKMSKIIKNLSENEKSRLTRNSFKFKDSQFVKDSLWEISLVIRKAIVANSGYWGVLFWTVFLLAKTIDRLTNSSRVKELANVTKQIASEFPLRALEHLRRFPSRPVNI